MNAAYRPESIASGTQPRERTPWPDDRRGNVPTPRVLFHWEEAPWGAVPANGKFPALFPGILSPFFLLQQANRRRRGGNRVTIKIMQLAILAMRLLEVMFFVGLAGSAVVVLISFFEDGKELFGKD
ncbi:MAG: hypothetical protein ABSC88_03505 [Terracidiphilus sp.]|jgi:hypothetical protein